MNWKILSLSTALFYLATSVSASQLEIRLVEPESFRDFSVSGMSETRTQPIFERELVRNLRRDVERAIGEDHRLILDFTDVDMAGDIQPWRNISNQDIRYMEQLYPPRLSFNYRVVGPAGDVIVEGSEDLRDMAFMMRIRSARSGDPFFFESEMLRDWIRRDLAEKVD